MAERQASNSTMDPTPTRTTDAEHLRLLSLFHYVVGAIGFLFACFPLVHVAFGVMLITHPSAFNDQGRVPAPAFMGYLFAALGGTFVLMGWTAATCTIISGRKLAQRKHRMFSFVMAAVLCMFVPFGTVLGIFTIIVLSKPSVQALYATPPRLV